MTDYVFFPSDDASNSDRPEEVESAELKARRLRHERLKELRTNVFDRAYEAAADQAEEDWHRKNTAPTSRTIAVRMPVVLLDRLSATAADAATGRSHLIRQMVADYLNSMDGQGIRFSGCLLSVDKAKPTQH